MKKKPIKLAKRVGACVGAAAVSATMLTGCNWFHPDRDEVETVYGPPPDWEDNYRPGDDEPVDVYGPPSDWEIYDPAKDEPAPVYGPPEDDYDPADDPVECIYGPPEDLGWDD